MVKIKENTLDKMAALAKRRGFIYQGSEIYGGLSGTWDYGPLGVALKNNLKNIWWQMMVDDRSDMYGIESAILMSPKVWQASGHTEIFNDPIVEDLKTKEKFRADHLLEDNGVADPEAMTFEEMSEVIKSKGIKSPAGNELSEVRSFNMMFSTKVGASGSEDSTTYLRPETAQGMFVNFKNILNSFQPDLPFGLAQSGRVFRNEISPREFLFRVREFEIMELEYFIRESDWEKYFSHWQEQFYRYAETIGLDRKKIHELEVPPEDLAHYSKRTIDFEYEFPFGTKEIGAVAYRTNFDLTNHMDKTKENLEYLDKHTGEKLIPHVIEPTFGLDRNLLAVMAEAWREEELNGEIRTYLAFKPSVAPIKVAVFPLLKNKPELVAKAKEVYDQLKSQFKAVRFDDHGNIGKRYRRQDEIGTPFCLTIDFDTLEDDTITLRDRDTGEQERMTIESLIDYLNQALNA